MVAIFSRLPRHRMQLPPRQPAGQHCRFNLFKCGIDKYADLKTIWTSYKRA